MFTKEKDMQTVWYELESNYGCMVADSNRDFSIFHHWSRETSRVKVLLRLGRNIVHNWPSFLSSSV